MRLCQATLREIQMPLVRPFETSFGRTTDRRILLVEVDADGVTGWGECVAGERPSYSPETIETAWLILRDFVWPTLARKEFSAAADVWEILSPIRGHNMAKAAIDHMARTAAIELVGHRIRVNIVHPGWIDTPGERKFFTDEQMEIGGKNLPWKRLGRPEEIAKAVNYVLSDDAEYMTGATLSIDGGVSLPWWSNRAEGAI